MGWFRPRGTTRGMAKTTHRILFTVRDEPSFPAELWERFRAITAARGETWAYVLATLVREYVTRHEQERRP